MFDRDSSNCQDPWLDTLTPEQRQMRQRKIDATADDLDHIIWLNSNDLQT